jgi:hypothetical protein
MPASNVVCKVVMAESPRHDGLMRHGVRCKVVFIETWRNLCSTIFY